MGPAPFLALANPAGEAAADEPVLPEAVERTQPIEVAYRFEHPATDRVSRDRVGDVDGRLVHGRRIPETSFTFGKGKAIYTTFHDEGGHENSRTLSEILEAAGVRPRLPLVRGDGVPVFENDEVTIVAVLRDFVPGLDPSRREAVVMALISGQSE